MTDRSRLLLLKQHLHVELGGVHHHIVAGASVVHHVWLLHHLAGHLLQQLLLATQVHLVHVTTASLLSLFDGLRFRGYVARLTQVGISMRVAAFVAIAAMS